MRAAASSSSSWLTDSAAWAKLNCAMCVLGNTWRWAWGISKPATIRPIRSQMKAACCARPMVWATCHRWAARSSGRSIQWSISSPGHHEGVPRRQGVDRQEGHAAVVPPDEGARELAVDDAGEERGHGGSGGWRKAGWRRSYEPGRVVAAGARYDPARDRAARAAPEHEPDPHRPERHHPRPAAAACRCSCGCCSSRTNRPRRRVAARRARRHRLGRRLRRPPLQPGERARQGARPGRRPPAVHRRRRRASSSTARRRCGSPSPCRPRGRASASR